MHTGAGCRSNCVLLLIIMLAVKQAVPAVAGPTQRAATHRTLDTRLMPGQFIDAQEEAVGDGRLTPCTHLTSSHML